MIFNGFRKKTDIIERRKCTETSFWYRAELEQKGRRKNKRKTWIWANVPFFRDFSACFLNWHSVKTCKVMRNKFRVKKSRNFTENEYEFVSKYSLVRNSTKVHRTNLVDNEISYKKAPDKIFLFSILQSWEIMKNTLLSKVLDTYKILLMRLALFSSFVY